MSELGLSRSPRDDRHLEDGQYLYNWDISQLASGIYAMVMDPGDSPTCCTEDPYAIIKVAK